MPPQYVVIGAGQTGRGFVARLLCQSGGAVTFVDKNTSLIHRLCRKKRYTVTFFGGGSTPAVVEGFSALTESDPAAPLAIAGADVVFTAVAGQNIAGLAPLFFKAQHLRAQTRGALRVVLCENAVNAPELLAKATPGVNARLAGGLIFCTTVGVPGSLDIFSENLSTLPYDAEALGYAISAEGFAARTEFALLVKRKIYTYNCINACIAYAGALRGFKHLADAAKDAVIAVRALRLKTELDAGLSRHFSVAQSEQEAFSCAAMEKFANAAIVDLISRNVRDCQRKLGPSERMAAPLRILHKQGLSGEALEHTIADAIVYGLQHEKFVWDGALLTDPSGILTHICGIDDSALIARITPRCLS